MTTVQKKLINFSFEEFILVTIFLLICSCLLVMFGNAQNLAGIIIFEENLNVSLFYIALVGFCFTIIHIKFWYTNRDD